MTATLDVGTRSADSASFRDWLGLAFLALPCLLYSMDLTFLNKAVPHLVADLGPSATQLLWIVDMYGFLLAGTQGWVLGRLYGAGLIS